MYYYQLSNVTVMQHTINIIFRRFIYLDNKIDKLYSLLITINKYQKKTINMFLDIEPNLNNIIIDNISDFVTLSTASAVCVTFYSLIKKTHRFEGIRKTKPVTFMQHIIFVLSYGYERDIRKIQPHLFTLPTVSYALGESYRTTNSNLFRYCADLKFHPLSKIRKTHFNIESMEFCLWSAYQRHMITYQVFKERYKIYTTNNMRDTDFFSLIDRLKLNRRNYYKNSIIKIPKEITLPIYLTSLTNHLEKLYFDSIDHYTTLFTTWPNLFSCNAVVLANLLLYSETPYLPVIRDFILNNTPIRFLENLFIKIIDNYYQKISLSVRINYIIENIFNHQIDLLLNINDAKYFIDIQTVPVPKINWTNYFNYLFCHYDFGNSSYNNYLIHVLLCHGDSLSISSCSYCTKRFKLKDVRNNRFMNDDNFPTKVPMFGKLLTHCGYSIQIPSPLFYVVVRNLLKLMVKSKEITQIELLDQLNMPIADVLEIEKNLIATDRSKYYCYSDLFEYFYTEKIKRSRNGGEPLSEDDLLGAFVCGYPYTFEMYTIIQIGTRLKTEYLLKILQFCETSYQFEWLYSLLLKRVSEEDLVDISLLKEISNSAILYAIYNSSKIFEFKTKHYDKYGSLIDSPNEDIIKTFEFFDKFIDDATRVVILLLLGRHSLMLFTIWIKRWKYLLRFSIKTIFPQLQNYEQSEPFRELVEDRFTEYCKILHSEGYIKPNLEFLRNVFIRENQKIILGIELGKIHVDYVHDSLSQFVKFCSTHLSRLNNSCCFVLFTKHFYYSRYISKDIRRIVKGHLH